MDEGTRYSLWIAFYPSDFSGFAVFTDELECYRYAVEHSMSAAPCPVGQDVPGALR